MRECPTSVAQGEGIVKIKTEFVKFTLIHVPLKIKEIQLDGEKIDEAFSPMSVTMTLDDDLDISRGDMLVRPNNQPQIEQDLEATICWMNAKAMQRGAKIVLRHTTKECLAVIKNIQ